MYGVFATDVRSGRHLHQFRNDGRVMDGSIYDRDRSAMGVLFGSEYFV